MSRTVLAATALLIAVTMGIGTVAPWAGVICLLAIAACTSCGLWVLRLVWPIEQSTAQSPDTEQPPDDGLARYLVAGAVGCAGWMLLASVSGWVFKATAPAAALFGVFAVLALPSAWRQRRAVSLASALLLLGIVLLALHHQFLEGIVWHGRLWFVDRWGDYRYHLHLGNLIRHHGMPVVNPYNWLATPLNTLGHRGVPLLVAVLRDFGGLHASDVGRIIGVGGYLLLGGSGACLASKVAPSRFARPVGAACALLWSPLVAWANAAHAFNHHGADVSYTQLSTADPFYYLAPAGLATGAYHNLTQLVALGVAAAAMVALGSDNRRWDARKIGLVCGLVAVSGLFKPSAFVVLVPALAVVMATRRSGWQVWGAFFVPIALSVLWYLLPSIVAGVEDAQGIGVDLSEWTLRSWLLGIGLAMGTVWVPGLLAAASLPAAVRGRVHWGVAETLLIAALGSVLFATIFVELDEGKRNHGNMTWAMAGIVPLCGPLVFKQATAWCRSKRVAARVAGWGLLVVATAQLVPGALYAHRYPYVRQRSIPLRTAQDVLATVTALPRSLRVLTDPSLRVSDMVPIFDRRYATQMAFSAPARKRWNAWRLLVYRGERNMTLTSAGTQVLYAYDAVIVRTENPDLRRFLRRLKFRPDPAHSNVTVTLMVRQKE